MTMTAIVYEILGTVTFLAFLSPTRPMLSMFHIIGMSLSSVIPTMENKPNLYGNILHCCFIFQADFSVKEKFKHRGYYHLAIFCL